MKNFWTHFFSAIAALSSIATLITFCSGWYQKLSCDDWIVTAVLAFLIVMVSAGYAFYQIRSIKKIVLNVVPGKLNIIIQEADLFAQKGIIVIGFNEYFDIHVGDGVVGENTLHGMFINKYFKGRTKELYKKILTSLNNQGIQPEAKVQRNNSFGKTAKYPLGTCAHIRDGENTYVVVALSHFDEYGKAYLTKIEYTKVIEYLMKYVETIAESKPVHLPILGTGLSRLDRSRNRILSFMLDSIDFVYTPTIPGGLYIDVRSLEKSNINLAHVKSNFENTSK